MAGIEKKGLGGDRSEERRRDETLRDPARAITTRKAQGSDSWTETWPHALVAASGVPAVWGFLPLLCDSRQHLDGHDCLYRVLMVNDDDQLFAGVKFTTKLRYLERKVRKGKEKEEIFCLRKKERK